MRSLLLLLVPAIAYGRPALPTWRHVTAVSKCRVRLDAAPDAEQKELLVTARKKLGATEVTLWDLGDSVRTAELPAAPTGSRALTGPAARKAAHDFIVARASLFGLVPAVDKIVPKETEQDTDGRWSAAGEITRTFEGLKQTESYLVSFDDDGHVAKVDLGPTRVLPAVPLCKVTPLTPRDPRVIANVIGTKLVVHAIGRDLDGGTVTAKSIGKRYPTVIIHDGNEVARVIAVEVKSADPKLARASWTFYVEGDTGEVLDQREHAPPDL